MVIPRKVTSYGLHEEQTRTHWSTLPDAESEPNKRSGTLSSSPRKLLNLSNQLLT